MKIDFEGKVALVTGAAGGIGFAVAKMFAEAGANVAMADINETMINQAAEVLSHAGHNVMAIALDVADETQVKEAIQSIVNRFGYLDVAYNNVGIHARKTGKLADLEGDDFDRVITVNLRGAWNCMKYELRQMTEQGKGGAIVNCASQSGLVGTPGIGAYTASKHGVIGLTKCAALEYARQGISINAICPGTSDTPMVQNAIARFPEHMTNVINAIPLGRMGRAEEIASMVLLLCSDYGQFAVGQTWAMDGGYTVM